MSCDTAGNKNGKPKWINLFMQLCHHRIKDLLSQTSIHILTQNYVNIKRNWNQIDKKKTKQKQRKKLSNEQNKIKQKHNQPKIVWNEDVVFMKTKDKSCQVYNKTLFTKHDV